ALISGVTLIAWAAWHVLYGYRHRVRFGMQIGLLGLAAWSFLMALAHGAGLMLIPALLPLCAPAMQGHGMISGALPVAVAAIGVHTLAMLAATGTVAIAVSRWPGVEVLKRGGVDFHLPG